MPRKHRYDPSVSAADFVRERSGIGAQVRAEAEAPLVVQLYSEGYSLSRIAEVLGLHPSQVSRIFHSDIGQLEWKKIRRERESIRQEIRDQAVYAAQGALDEIIRLSQSAESAAVRRLAAKDVLEMAEVAPIATRGGISINLGDEAISRLCNVINELRTPVVEVDTLPLSEASSAG